MEVALFEDMAEEELRHVPPRFARRLTNVAIVIEEEPSREVCKREGLGPEETLLGLYHGVPATARGAQYSAVVPDTITLYRLPLLQEAEALMEDGKAGDERSALRLAIRETLWHELGHHFGLGEAAIASREEAGTNVFGATQARYVPPLFSKVRHAVRKMFL